MNFSRFLDIQSWWEVPSIAYFCSLFRTAFNLLDFDIEELEEALLTDGTEESASSLLTELIVRLLNGCLGNNDISAFNYQMYLRRLFRRKCQETGRYNPFNTDIDFQFLPLRTKVEILYALCDFRLDADDVYDLFKNLEAESLRVEPLGWDDNYSAYWYFYGTRLYREDIIKKSKAKNKKKKGKDNKKKGWFYGDDWLDDDETERVWQVVCFTEEDWTHLTEKFSKATSKVEKELHRSLSQNFLPEIPRLFQEKERLQRKRLLEAPRRTSSRVLQKIKQKEEELKQSTHDIKEEVERKVTPELARENRAKRRNLIRSKSISSETSESTIADKKEMPQKVSKRPKEKKSENALAANKGEQPTEPLIKTGRKTNNSLASATGQILIPDNDEPVSGTRKKLKTSQIFSQTEEDIQTDMYKVLEQLTAHEDAWPFMDPVEEEYAPNYYAVIRRPMDLRKMEERLDSGYYTDFSMFKADFKLIVNNCRLYNGQDNEYTTMVDNLQTAFERLTEKYMHKLSSSDEEIAVEYQLPTPSRKHKLKPSESPNQHKRKKRKSHSDAGEQKSVSLHIVQGDKQEESLISEVKKSKESHKSKDGRVKKKRKGHHRHGKHSKNHKKDSHKSERSEYSKTKHSKKQKHAKNKDKASKKSKQKKKKTKRHEQTSLDAIAGRADEDSIESSNRSRSASPLPSIHTPTPSPSELEQSNQVDSDFYKDKFDKIKERRRHTTKDVWESLFDYKHKTVDKEKQNLHIPEKDKNQKLRETIEKLKAKNEKYKDSTIFNNLFTPGHSNINKTGDVKNVKSPNKDAESDNEDVDKDKINGKKGNKKNTTKNECASEALEQVVKDISKWLDDAPKGSAVSSRCASPAQTISTEEHENSRLDDELYSGEKGILMRKDTNRKRPSSREPKLVKRREIQRTIDRLQPGKSKGNLLTNVSNKNQDKPEEIIPLGPLNKVRDSTKGEESSPKLSLGSVLPIVEFAIGNDHNFGKNEDGKTEELKEVKTSDKQGKEKTEKKIEDVIVQPNKKDAEVETEPTVATKPNQEKATPNLSAWFKAFGAPKNTPSTSTSSILIKRKIDDTDEKPSETPNTEQKTLSPTHNHKVDSSLDPETPTPEGGDSPLPNVITTPRQRRTSTGSSVSERSSFSQDLDSPRHQMSHTSPLLRSPASPRTEDFQKISYPIIINGTVRAGFYQDTTSMKSSPEKSCSPREATLSPYSQHVYASNSVTACSTPNYFVDHNKSPLPTYTQNPPPFYDTSKVSTVSKLGCTQEEYTALGAESYPQNQYTGPFSAYSPYTQTSSSYSQSQQSPPPNTTNTSSMINSSQAITDTKTSLFPVKKRMYNESDNSSSNRTKATDNKVTPDVSQSKTEYQKNSQSLHSGSSLPSATPSVDEIALQLSEKSEITKLNNMRDKAASETIERKMENIGEPVKLIDPIQGNNDGCCNEIRMPISMIKDNVDMINMGYMNPDVDRRNNTEAHNNYTIEKDISKPSINNTQKPYEVEATAINLGMSNHTMQKSVAKAANIPSNIPLAHSQERNICDMTINQNIPHAHHNQYEPPSTGQSNNNFSMNDIKFYAGPSTPSGDCISYSNWKITSQISKQQTLAPAYASTYTNSAEKLKPNISSTNANLLNYNKTMQHQQYTFELPRSTPKRSLEIKQFVPPELRIPKPRGILKSDHLNVSPTLAETESASKTIDVPTKSQKSDKIIQNHPLINSNPYKAPYSNHSTLPIDTLRNLPSIPQMLERFPNDERYLANFSGGTSSIYHDKSFQMAQMFNKGIPSDGHPSSSSANIYSQPSSSVNKDIIEYKPSSGQAEMKNKTKRKRTLDSKQSPTVSSQNFHSSSVTSDVLPSMKTSMIPTGAFNFGTSSNIALSGALYSDNTGFSIEDFRNNTANLMAANYMVAAVAHQQRNNVEVNTDKLVKPAHQNSNHGSGSFPFIGHSQVRAGYPFVSSDPASPLYQQYIQRHQEELFRQTGAQIMSLYPSGYPASLGVRQPYDSINRPSWL